MVPLIHPLFSFLRFNVTTGAVIGADVKPLKEILNEDARIAYRLICSFGTKYNCAGRVRFTIISNALVVNNQTNCPAISNFSISIVFVQVGFKRLVDSSNTINYDGFYNYLTAWYNADNMMYYVSQASFFPAPPKWSAFNSVVIH